MARPKMERIHITTVDPRVHISKEGTNFLRKELKKNNMSIRGMGRACGISENKALHLICNGDGYLSVLNKVLKILDIKAIVEVDEVQKANKFYGERKRR